MTVIDEAITECLAAFLAAGHEPVKDIDGQPDSSAFDVEEFEGPGGHNGFRCAKCGDSICIWCFGFERTPFNEIDPCTGSGNSKP